MAAVDLSAIASALATLFEDKIAMQINRSVVLAQLLEVKPGNGKNLTWNARFSAASYQAAVIADGADVAGYNSDLKVPATLDYGTYHDPFSISGKARAAAALTGNPADLEDLYAEEIEESVTRLASNIGSDFYVGTGATDHIMGLTATNGPLKATGTYANISRATYTEWASNVLANGGVERALSFSLMRQATRAVYDASGEHVDLIMCGSLIHEKYGELFGDNRRYLQEVYLRGQKIVLDGGYKALEFDGIPVVKDRHCPAGKMLFLTTSHIKIRPLPHAPDAVNRSTGMIGLHGTPEGQYGAGKNVLTARINPLSVTGDAYKFQLITYPQIQVKRCNAQASLEDLPTS